MKIVQQYCGDVDNRIKACRSRQIADILKSRMCGELENICNSEMLNAMLNSYVDKIIDHTFDENGNNKLLED